MYKVHTTSLTTFCRVLFLHPLPISQVCLSARCIVFLFRVWPISSRKLISHLTSPSVARSYTVHELRNFSAGFRFCYVVAYCQVRNCAVSRTHSQKWIWSLRLFLQVIRGVCVWLNFVLKFLYVSCEHPCVIPMSYSFFMRHTIVIYINVLMIISRIFIANLLNKSTRCRFYPGHSTWGAQECRTLRE